jgi:MOSC domain-containing protein YiiM
MVRKLDIDGDAQADLAGHGGEHRAVFVYQMDSYHYWERFLGRSDFTPATKVSRIWAPSLICA